MAVLQTKLKTRQSMAGFIFALPSMAGFALFFVRERKDLFI